MDGPLCRFIIITNHHVASNVSIEVLIFSHLTAININYLQPFFITMAHVNLNVGGTSFNALFLLMGVMATPREKSKGAVGALELTARPSLLE